MHYLYQAALGEVQITLRISLWRAWWSLRLFAGRNVKPGHWRTGVTTGFNTILHAGI